MGMFVFTARHFSRHGLLSIALVLLMLAGCTTTNLPVANIPIPVPDFQELPFRLDFWRQHDRDFSDMEWVAAFDAVHETLAREYPFTEYRGIDWAQKREEFRPRIVAAAEAKDSVAWYDVLRQYIYSIPDGNMGLFENDEAREALIGGGYGFVPFVLDNGTVIATVIDEDGPAAEAGMAWGAEITTWRGVPVMEALESSPWHWADRPPATDFARRFEKARLATRAPVGTESAIVFQNPDGAAPVAATLTAVDDHFANLGRTYLHESEVGEFSAPVKSDILPNGYGYIKVQFLAPTITVPFPLQEFKAALIKMGREEVPGIVLDLRNNSGGTRELIADALGHFVTEDKFFEDMAYYDADAGNYVVAEEARLTIKPRRPHYDKPMAVLIDYRTLGGGEGMARILDGLPSVIIVGISPTHGSFAPGGGYIELPNDAAVYYPLGRSLDAEGHIQGESAPDGSGGVAPDVTIPLTRANVRRAFVDGQDVGLDVALEALQAPEAESEPAMVQ